MGFDRVVRAMVEIGMGHGEVVCGGDGRGHGVGHGKVGRGRVVTAWRDRVGHGRGEWVLIMREF